MKYFLFFLGIGSVGLIFMFFSDSLTEDTARETRLADVVTSNRTTSAYHSATSNQTVYLFPSVLDNETTEVLSYSVSDGDTSVIVVILPEEISRGTFQCAYQNRAIYFGNGFQVIVEIVNGVAVAQIEEATRNRRFHIDCHPVTDQLSNDVLLGCEGAAESRLFPLYKTDGFLAVCNNGFIHIADNQAQELTGSEYINYAPNVPVKLSVGTTSGTYVVFSSNVPSGRIYELDLNRMSYTSLALSELEDVAEGRGAAGGYHEMDLLFGQEVIAAVTQGKIKLLVNQWLGTFPTFKTAASPVLNEEGSVLFFAKKGQAEMVEFWSLDMGEFHVATE